MRTIRSIPYATDFYWKGDRYRQLIRYKDNKANIPVVCYDLYKPYNTRVEMPLGRKVKPVIRIKNG